VVRKSPAVRRAGSIPATRTIINIGNNMDKQLISETGNYRVYAEFLKPTGANPNVNLRFITEWNDTQRVALDLTLNADQLGTLKQFINSAI
jgi:hypothetical protein